jgi:hypothetical protein
MNFDEAFASILGRRVQSRSSCATSVLEKMTSKGRDIDPSCPFLSRIGPRLFHFAWTSAQQMLRKERTGRANTGLGEGSDQLPWCNSTSWAGAPESGHERACAKGFLIDTEVGPLFRCLFAPFLSCAWCYELTVRSLSG